MINFETSSRQSLEKLEFCKNFVLHFAQINIFKVIMNCVFIVRGRLLFGLYSEWIMKGANSNHLGKKKTVNWTVWAHWVSAFMQRKQNNNNVNIRIKDTNKEF